MGKVSKKNRLEFRAFIEDNLNEEAMEDYSFSKIPSRYNYEDLLVLVHPEKLKYGLILQNSNWTQSATKKTIRDMKINGIVPIQIFYKDGENFHVRLGSSGHYRSDKAFKMYTKEQIDKMVHLRQNEKIDLEMLGSSYLTYYQPETSRLSQSIISYKPKKVILDHSHVRDNSFARGGLSVDYKILDDKVEPISTGNFFPTKTLSGKFLLYRR